MTQDFATVMALVHVVAVAAKEAVAAIAHTNLVVGLVLVTPVAVGADVGLAAVAYYLGSVGRNVAM